MPLLEFAQFAECVGELVTQRSALTICVEDRKLIDWFEQELVVMLAMHVDDLLADSASHGGGGGLAVDTDARPPGGEQLACYEQLFARLDGCVNDGADLCTHRRVVQFKQTRDTRFVGAGANHVGGAAQAKQYFESADQQTLARAGRAGETVESVVKRDAYVLDDRQIGDVKFAKHPCFRMPICDVRFPVRGRAWTSIEKSEIGTRKSDIPKCPGEDSNLHGI